MTKETWNKYNSKTGRHEYIGKHAAVTFKVWRVINADGPVEQLFCCGIEEVKQAVHGTWDHEVWTLDGEPVNI